MSDPRYKRLLLKLSGEALAGRKRSGIDLSVLRRVTGEIAAVQKKGVEIAIVCGGGNFLRGVAEAKSGYDRATADYMGMLTTVINSMALQNELEKAGIQTRVQSAIEMHQIAEPYIRRRAIRHLEKGRVVIFAAGTGNPYFTTDTAAALRANEIGAEILFKATKVDGVYDCDPKNNPGAQLFNRISLQYCLQNAIDVMDKTAISLCLATKLPVYVFNMFKKGNLIKALSGENVGTYIGED